MERKELAHRAYMGIRLSYSYARFSHCNINRNISCHLAVAAHPHTTHLTVRQKPGNSFCLRRSWHRQFARALNRICFAEYLIAI